VFAKFEQSIKMMNVKEYRIKRIVLSSWIYNQPQKNITSVNNTSARRKLDPFWLLRQWLNKIQINEPTLAIRLCKMIPAQCPFERKISIFGRTLINIPPLCKLNPLYNELVALRFRAICYLADECGEDVSTYC
jgi:Mo-dependent nitrogenase C-terminus